MVQEVTVYKTTTGKPFDTEFEAWSEELRNFLVKHGADNDAIARKIVQAVVDDQPETLCALADIVENMHRCAPPVVLPMTDEWDEDAAATIGKISTNGSQPPVSPAQKLVDDWFGTDRPCKSPVACSRNHLGICSCY